jgi:hypothetical protein
VTTITASEPSSAIGPEDEHEPCEAEHQDQQWRGPVEVDEGERLLRGVVQRKAVGERGVDAGGGVAQDGDPVAGVDRRRSVIARERDERPPPGVCAVPELDVEQRASRSAPVLAGAVGDGDHVGGLDLPADQRRGDGVPVAGPEHRQADPHRQDQRGGERGGGASRAGLEHAATLGRGARAPCDVA